MGSQRKAYYAPRKAQFTELGGTDLILDERAPVLRRVISGLPNKQVAYELAIGEGIAKGYRAQMMEKMEAKSLPELVRSTQQLERTRDSNGTR